MCVLQVPGLPVVTVGQLCSASVPFTGTCMEEGEVRKGCTTLLMERRTSVKIASGSYLENMMSFCSIIMNF